MRSKWLLATASAALLAFPGVARAQSGTANVNTQMSIYRAGGNTYSSSGCGGLIVPCLNNGGGIDPFLVTLNGGTGRVLTVSATGSASYCPNGGCVAGTPDGPAIGSTGLNAGGKISGISAPSSGFLVGVFLGATLPGATPSSISFGGLDFTTLSPVLGQQFFIGNGFTSGNLQQKFFVPDGATSLYFGIADGFSFSGNPGAYDDNVGTYAAQYNVSGLSTVPEPSTVALMGLGMLGIAVAARRRRA